MLTQAYFENIQKEILVEINKASKSLQIAVAWITDTLIFNTLCEKAKKGVRVELILVNDDINNEMTSFDHKILERKGGSVYFVNPKDNGAIMHHKFCIIDDCTVITGSYNWSNKAKNNDENIIVAWEACDLGAQFQKEFNSIIERINGSKKSSGNDNIANVIKRLELIKNFIVLEEVDEVKKQITKLKELELPPKVSEIIKYLDKNRFHNSIKLIESYLEEGNSVVVFRDNEVFALKLEMQSLDLQLVALENERIDIEKVVQEFNVRHTVELGDLILKVLNLRKIDATTEKAKSEAEQSEKEYKDCYEENIVIKISVLNEEEKQSIKSMYREACMLCHPDKFQNEPDKQHLAEDLFKNLSVAYQKNQLNSVSQILMNLKNGSHIVNSTLKANDKEILKLQLEQIRQKIAETIQYIQILKNTDSYLTAIKNTDWDKYFSEIKIILESEIEWLLKK